MLLDDILRRAAERAGDEPAVVHADRAVTFGELDREARQLALALTARAGRGDRVAVIADNAVEWVTCYYGIPLAGMVLAAVNQRLSPVEQAAVLEAAEPTVVIGQRARLEQLAPLAAQLPSVTSWVAMDDGWDDFLGSGTAGGPPPDRRPTDLAWLLFTSGTTGAPKGVMLTHRSLTTAVLGAALVRPVLADDVYLMPYPLCHVAGYNVLTHHLHARPVVLTSAFRAPEVVEAVNTHHVTACSLAPTMLSSLLDHLDESGATLPSLRSIGYGAAAIPEPLLRRAMARLDVAFSQTYGMTELSGAGALLDDDAHRRGLTSRPSLLRAAGRPLPLVSMRVVDDQLEDVGPGEVGEVVVQGNQVAAGYWRDPEATADAFVAGWFRTGDLGRWDAEGFLHIVDRRKDVIITGGENVASREVEEALLEHPAVAGAAVVGVPDVHWGEAICAVVERRPGTDVDAAALVDHVRRRLSSFKRPRHVLFVDELPRNAVGKVVKADVRLLARARVERA